MLSFVERRLVRTLSGVACGALAFAIAMPAAAQTAQPVTQADPTPTTPSAPATALADDETPPASASSATNADIVVTGSRIKGVAAVGSAVIAIDQAKIAQEPVTSSADLLRRVPQIVGLGQNRNGGTAQNGAANATRGSGINLRGIGTNATLVLYDGKRLPPQGTQGQYTDPSVIPSIMLSRVEVVRRRSMGRMRWRAWSTSSCARTSTVPNCARAAASPTTARIASNRSPVFSGRSGMAAI
jgi:iron complex outermembrane receptor protein